MNDIKLLSKEGLIWMLTALLYACFSIATTDATWSTYSLLLITAAVAVLTASKYGMPSFQNFDYQRNVLIFAAFAFLSSLWAIRPSDAIEKGITIVELTICMSVFMWSYSNISNAFSKLLSAIMWGGYVVTLYTYVFIGLSNVMFILTTGARLESTFDNVNTIGLICAISILISLYFLSKKRNWLLILLDMPTIVLLAACGSRKAMIILVLGALAIYVLISNKKQNKLGLLFRVFLAAISLIVAVYALAQFSIFSGLNARMEGLYAMITGVGDVDHSTQVREEMVELGLSIFKDNPIFGIGIGCAHVFTLQRIGHDCYLHNNYAEMLANGGIVGTFLFYRIYWFVVNKIRKYKSYANSEGKILLILLFALLISEIGLVSYYSKLYYFFFMVFYLFIAQEKRKSNG